MSLLHQAVTTVSRLKIIAFMTCFTWQATSLANTALKCQEKNIQSFINGAQKELPETLELALDYARCPDMMTRERAVYWGIYYLEQSGRTNEASKLINRAFPFTNAKSGKTLTLYKARRGQWQDLKKALDTADRAFESDTEAYATLARGSMYNHQFQQATEAYEAYLRVNPGNINVDIEYLYALLWAKRWQEAESRITILRSYSTTPHMEGSLFNAENKVLAIKEALGVDKNSTDQVLGGQIAAVFTSKNYGTGSFQQNFSLLYQNLIGVGIVHRRLQSHFDDVDQEGLEFLLTGSTGVSGFQINTQLAFFSIIDKSVYGEFGIGWLQKNYAIEVGFRHFPTSFKEPIPEEFIDQMSQQLYLDFNWKHLFTYQGILERELDYSLYETHNFALQIPILWQDVTQGLFFLIPLEFRNHPKQSPFFKTEPFNLYGAGGLRYKALLRSGLDVDVAASSGLTYRNRRNDENSYRNLLTSRVNISLIYASNSSLKWTANADLFFIERDIDDVKENRSDFSLGIIFVPRS
ncbi:MAG: hypothetical protein HRU19_22760 [Pseudobacteriovorax sp.]|nr:hypothetical protein [Pseudobacteriovorax sp.]